MKKYLLTLSAFILTALTFTSCLNSSHTEEIYTSRLGSDECFNYVKDLETGESIITHGASYIFIYNFTEALIDVQISGLQIASNFSGLSFKLPSFKMGADNKKGFYVCSGENITPVNTSENYVFNKFSFRSLPARSYNGVSQPVFCLTFTINNRYQVTVLQKDNMYFGTTNGAAIDGSALESNYDAAYAVTLDPNNKKAVLRIYNAKFGPNMMPQTFGVKDLPVEFNSAGYVIREMDKSFPLFDTSNKTIEGWSISDLSINASLNTGATIAFKCDLGENGSFHVNAPLEYLIYPENEKQ